MARDMEELCPNALLLNYTNPMAAVCWALGEAAKVPFIGLCHGVQTTLDLIAGYVGVPKEEIDYVCAGINHMAWFLKLEHGGRDLYPTFRANCEKPEYYRNEKVRCEAMRHFGYFMTESTGHLSEYLPWFRSSKRALELYCDEPDFVGETGAYGDPATLARHLYLVIGGPAGGLLGRRGPNPLSGLDPDEVTVPGGHSRVAGENLELDLSGGVNLDLLLEVLLVHLAAVGDGEDVSDVPHEVPERPPPAPAPILAAGVKGFLDLPADLVADVDGPEADPLKLAPHLLHTVGEGLAVPVPGPAV
jgi:hypothetical protein